MKKSEVSLSLYAKMGYYEIENTKVVCMQCNIEVKEGLAITDNLLHFCSNDCFTDFNLVNGKECP